MVGLGNTRKISEVDHDHSQEVKNAPFVVHTESAPMHAPSLYRLFLSLAGGGCADPGLAQSSLQLLLAALAGATGAGSSGGAGLRDRDGFGVDDYDEDIGSDYYDDYNHSQGDGEGGNGVHGGPSTGDSIDQETKKRRIQIGAVSTVDEIISDLASNIYVFESSSSSSLRAKATSAKDANGTNSNSIIVPVTAFAAPRQFRQSSHISRPVDAGFTLSRCLRAALAVTCALPPGGRDSCAFMYTILNLIASQVNPTYMTTVVHSPFTAASCFHATPGLHMFALRSIALLANDAATAAAPARAVQTQSSAATTALAAREAESLLTELSAAAATLRSADDAAIALSIPASVAVSNASVNRSAVSPISSLPSPTGLDSSAVIRHWLSLASTYLPLPPSASSPSSSASAPSSSSSLQLRLCLLHAATEGMAVGFGPDADDELATDGHARRRRKEGERKKSQKWRGEKNGRRGKEREESQKEERTRKDAKHWTSRCPGPSLSSLSALFPSAFDPLPLREAKVASLSRVYEAARERTAVALVRALNDAAAEAALSMGESGSPRKERQRKGELAKDDGEWERDERRGWASGEEALYLSRAVRSAVEFGQWGSWRRRRQREHTNSQRQNQQKQEAKERGDEGETEIYDSDEKDNAVALAKLARFWRFPAEVLETFAQSTDVMAAAGESFPSLYVPHLSVPISYLPESPPP